MPPGYSADLRPPQGSFNRPSSTGPPPVGGSNYGTPPPGQDPNGDRGAMKKAGAAGLLGMLAGRMSGKPSNPTKPPQNQYSGPPGQNYNSPPPGQYGGYGGPPGGGYGGPPGGYGGPPGGYGGYPPQGYPPQGYPPQGYPPQGYPQQQQQAPPKKHGMGAGGAAALGVGGGLLGGLLIGEALEHHDENEYQQGYDQGYDNGDDYGNNDNDYGGGGDFDDGGF
jgi:hypothetical protein